MKQLKHKLLVLAIAGALFTNAQNSSDFQQGTITTYANETSAGTIRPMFKQRGVIIFQNGSQQKKQFSPNDVASFTVGNENYNAYTNDFYRIVVKGDKAILLERVTDNGGKIYYNGTTPVNTPSQAGKIGDLYVLKAGSTEPILASGTAFQKNATALFGDCNAVVGALAVKTIDVSALKNLVTQYNSCK
jgi:hypothetical protein